ncbi:MAG: membrane protein insertase YidC [Bacteroidales bacterium]
MKRDTIIGLLLVGLILVGFSLYNNKQYEKVAAEKRKQDSITLVRRLDFEKQIAIRRQDSLSKLTPGQRNLYEKNQVAQNSENVSNIVNQGNNKDNNYSYTYKNKFLETALNSDAESYTLENDKIIVDYTTLGGQANQVIIKKYFNYDSTTLYLIKDGYSKFNIQLFAPNQINTEDLNYKMISHTDSSLVMRLYFAENSYIENSYKLPPGKFMVDYSLHMIGMDKFIPRNVTGLDASWNLDLPRMEKGYKNEKNYSTVVFKYPGESSIDDLGLRKDSSQKNVKTNFQWVAFQQQFFSAIMVAEDNFSSGDFSYKFYPETDKENKLMACSSNMYIPIKISSDITIPFRYYYGPNHFKTLKKYNYGFEKIVPMGGWLIGWINRIVIVNVFDYLSRFINSFGLIILLLTLLVKLVISPLTIKSYKSSAKMNVLKPEIAKISERYPKKEDAMKKQQATMDLYKKGGVNMFGGCLPMLLQFPILLAMFRFFPSSFELRQQPFLWASDLSSYDSIYNFGFNIPMYGDHISLFALLMAVSMFFYSKMTSSQMDTSQQGMGGMKFMTVWFMPIFMGVICNNFSAGLSYYYLLSNIITMLQTWITRKFLVDEDKLLRKIHENSSKPAKPKSKWQQRLEQAAKAQQQAAKNGKR